MFSFTNCKWILFKIMIPKTNFCNLNLFRLAQLISIFISVWLTAAGIIHLVSMINVKSSSFLKKVFFLNLWANWLIQTTGMTLARPCWPDNHIYYKGCKTKWGKRTFFIFYYLEINILSVWSQTFFYAILGIQFLLNISTYVVMYQDMNL